MVLTVPFCTSLINSRLIPEGYSGAIWLRRIFSNIKAVTLVLHFSSILYLDATSQASTQATAQTTCGQQVSQEFHLPENLRAALWDLTSTMREYHDRLFRSWQNNPPQIVLWSNILARHLRCYRVDGQKSPQAVMACLPMSLSVLAAEQLTYLSCWIWTADTDFFQRAMRDKKTPHFFKEKGEGVSGFICIFSGIFLVSIEFSVSYH